MPLFKKLGGGRDRWEFGKFQIQDEILYKDPMTGKEEPGVIMGYREGYDLYVLKVKGEMIVTEPNRMRHR